MTQEERKQWVLVKLQEWAKMEKKRMDNAQSYFYKGYYEGKSEAFIEAHGLVEFFLGGVKRNGE